MFVETSVVFIEDLRFALEVMEDRSHLGLNAERAAKLRNLMHRRISVAEEALAKNPARITSPGTIRRQITPA
jgi:hypothetical protein